MLYVKSCTTYTFKTIMLVEEAKQICFFKLFCKYYSHYVLHENYSSFGNLHSFFSNSNVYHLNTDSQLFTYLSELLIFLRTSYWLFHD